MLAGTDSNGNGLLEVDEVASTQYICNGGAVPTLVSTSDEAPGSHCINGGTRLSSGLDLDGNGTLGSTEVISTGYVCNGASGKDGLDGRDGSVGLAGSSGATGSTGPAGAQGAPGAQGQQGLQGSTGSAGAAGNDGLRGAPGAQGPQGTQGPSGAQGDAGAVGPAGARGPQGPTGDLGPTGIQGAPGNLGIRGLQGTNVLISSVIEAVGSNCPFGGFKIQWGSDLNGNGVLDSPEVHIDYVCNGTPVVVLSQTDVSGTSIQAEANNAYLANNADQAVIVTLPANAQVGDVVRVVGIAAGGWRIAQSAGQAVNVTRLAPGPSAAPTWTTLGVGGGLSGSQYDAVELICIGSKRFSALSHTGAIAYQ